MHERKQNSVCHLKKEQRRILWRIRKVFLTCALWAAHLHSLFVLKKRNIENHESQQRAVPLIGTTKPL